MSVINKMLRDLDRRQVNTASLAAIGVARSGSTSSPLTAGSAASAGSHRMSAVRFARSRRVTLMLGVLTLLVVIGSAVWWLRKSLLPNAATVQPQPSATATQSPAQAVATAVVALPLAAPAAPLAALVGGVAEVPKPVALSSKASEPRVHAAENPVGKLSTQAAVPQPSAQVAPSQVAMASVVQPLSSKLTLKPSPDTLQVPPKVSAAASSAAEIARVLAQQPPSQKPNATLALVAQAQGLWQEGEHSAALLLLKGAVQRLESASVGAAPDVATVATLAREYARCGLASGQTAEVLATLEQLEPQLATVADIWAIRGNAAQRLGHHAQAVAAYQQSLALSPNEPRWMLGAAVSMAALGNIGPAAELAENARLARALPPDVANYVRQLGVSVRSD